MELIYLKGLEDVSKGFPMEKMEDVLENEEKYTEELLEVLDYTIKNAEELCKDEKYIIHVFAMYILAYFGEERAYPAVVAIAKLPSSIIDPLLEDVITEGLASIIMSVYDGNPEPIKEIVECSECNLFVRWAAIEALLALAANGAMDEDEVICYIKGLFNHKLRRIDKNISDAPVQDSSDIDPQESEEEMMDNCEDIFFEYFVQDINALLKKQISKEEVRGDRACRYITKSDVFNLSDWYGFSGEAYKSLSIVGYGEDDFSFNDVKVIPFKNVEKTGQNDPCPCGSGKKYKECCGKQENK